MRYKTYSSYNKLMISSTGNFTAGTCRESGLILCSEPFAPSLFPQIGWGTSWRHWRSLPGLLFTPPRKQISSGNVNRGFLVFSKAESMQIAAGNHLEEAIYSPTGRLPARKASISENMRSFWERMLLLFSSKSDHLFTQP